MSEVSGRTRISSVTGQPCSRARGLDAADGGGGGAVHAAVHSGRSQQRLSGSASAGLVDSDRVSERSRSTAGRQGVKRVGGATKREKAPSEFSAFSDSYDIGGVAPSQQVMPGVAEDSEPSSGSSTDFSPARDARREVSKGRRDEKAAKGDESHIGNSVDVESQLSTSDLDGLRRDRQGIVTRPIGVGGPHTTEKSVVSAKASSFIQAGPTDGRYEKIRQGRRIVEQDVGPVSRSSAIVGEVPPAENDVGGEAGMLEPQGASSRSGRDGGRNPSYPQASSVIVRGDVAQKLASASSSLQSRNEKGQKTPKNSKGASLATLVSPESSPSPVALVSSSSTTQSTELVSGERPTKTTRDEGEGQELSEVAAVQSLAGGKSVPDVEAAPCSGSKKHARQASWGTQRTPGAASIGSWRLSPKVHPMSDEEETPAGQAQRHFESASK